MLSFLPETFHHGVQLLFVRDPIGIYVVTGMAAVVGVYFLTQIANRLHRASNHARFGSGSSIAVRRERLHRRVATAYGFGTILIVFLIAALLSVR